MSTWTKKAMFVGLPRYLEQLLGACYAKEGWELYRFRTVEGERPPQGIHTYDCEVDSAEAAQVFSVQNLDLLVYRLERDPSVAMRRLDALLRVRSSRSFCSPTTRCLPPGRSRRNAMR